MTPPFIIANWKSYKTEKEAKQWLEVFKKHQESLANKTIILLAPYTCLPMLKKEIDEANLPLLLGAQNVSPFPQGAYTGEINAVQLKELVSFVLVGHSERHRYFSETDEMIAQKAKAAKDVGLRVILCIQDAKSSVPEGIDIVAYEPISAIGTGKSDTPENAAAVIREVKQQGIRYGVYGGSVTGKNVASFTQNGSDGVLVGSASLDAESFLAIINHA